MIEERGVRRLGRAALFTAGYFYLLIGFGGLVRITGSGLGCGDVWPSCNGSWIPPWDLTIWIEWTHRLLGAFALGPVIVLLALAWSGRRRAAYAGTAAPALWIVGLLVVQALLGAVTVWLDTSPAVTTVHFVNALLLLAAALTLAARALRGPSLAPERRAAARLPLVAALLALAVITWGGFTANLSAGLVCGGFPLCNGELFPSSDVPRLTGLMHINWTHRVLAYALAGIVLVGAWRAWRRGGARGVRFAALASALLVVAQVAIAAFMVELKLPAEYRALHVLAGTALFAALWVWLLLARREVRGDVSRLELPYVPAERAVA